MVTTFEMACTEVLEVLKILPEEEYNKIPLNEINNLESKKDKNYKFSIDKSVPLDKINISKKAYAIILVLWEKYFASNNQKQKLYDILKDNYQKEELKKAQYSYNNLFPKKEKLEVTSMVPVKKEKWYKKIYEFLRKIFCF